MLSNFFGLAKKTINKVKRNMKKKGENISTLSHIFIIFKEIKISMNKIYKTFLIKKIQII